MKSHLQHPIEVSHKITPTEAKKRILYVQWTWVVEHVPSTTEKTMATLSLDAGNANLSIRELCTIKCLRRHLIMRRQKKILEAWGDLPTPSTK